MKKLIISTYSHWNSYGSILQSLALQEALLSLGTSPRTIVFQNEEDWEPVKKLQQLTPREVINYIYKSLHQEEIDSSRNKCLEFMKNNTNRIVYETREKLYENKPEADMYIAGSDQIWHPGLCRGDLFLDYVPKNKKKISYAASMGKLDIPQENVDKFSDLLKNFDTISVRESDMIPIISKYVEKKIFQHIDPTFLLDAEDWRKYEKPYSIKKPYILVYPLYWEKKLNKQLKKLFKETGMPIISIQNSWRPVYSSKALLDVGVGEFLWLIDNAEMVITSSFHGTAFSIIFNKQFIPIVNPAAKSRINSLLNTLSINYSSVLEMNKCSIDYKKVNYLILQEKKRSMDYLRREINGEK